MRWPERRSPRAEPKPLPLPDKPSIAVLPFTNMSSDPEQSILWGRHRRRHYHYPFAHLIAARHRAEFDVCLQG